MKSRRRLSILIFFIGAFLLFNNFYVKAEQKQKLPRSFGPITLGMSVKDFKKLTNIEPTHCATCVEGELNADFYLDEKTIPEHMRKKPFKEKPIKLKDAYLNYQPMALQPEKVGCYFYKGKLYSIVLVGVKDTLEAVKSRYIKALGKQPAVVNHGTEISELRWEDSSILLRIAYLTEDEKGGIASLDITYGDIKLMSQVPPWDEDEKAIKGK